MPKLEDFSVGDKVRVETSVSDFTAEVGCIHDDRLYLTNHDKDGGECEKHNTSWVCFVKESGEVAASGLAGTLELLEKSNKKSLTKDDLINERIAIHTPTQEDCNRLMEVIEEETDWRWGNSKKKPTDVNEWKYYREENYISKGSLGLTCGRTRWLKKGKTKIITTDEAIEALRGGEKNEFTLADMKEGFEVAMGATLQAENREEFDQMMINPITDRIACVSMKTYEEIKKRHEELVKSSEPTIQPICQSVREDGKWGIKPFCEFCKDELTNTIWSEHECYKNKQKLYISDGKPLHKFTSKLKSMYNNTKKKLKNATLSDEEKTLRKEGLHDECGRMTDEAKSLMLDELAEERWEDRKGEIAEVLSEEE